MKYRIRYETYQARGAIDSGSVDMGEEDTTATVFLAIWAATLDLDPQHALTVRTDGFVHGGRWIPPHRIVDIEEQW